MGTTRIGPPVDRYTDRLLSGGIADWGYFLPVTTRNRSIMIDFDHRRPLSSDNDRFRSSLADFGRYQPREKEEEGEERGEPGIWRCSPDPDPSSRLHEISSRRLLRGKMFLLPGRRNVSLCEHLGMIDDRFKEPNSLECVKFVNKIAEENWSRYTAEEITPLTGHLLKYPIKVEADGKVGPLPNQECFPDVGGKILGAYTALPDTLTM
ncbi:hypothetical protein BHE74_00059770 [Ensete ventricosum]|nr:hypothetical protein BHE74_00059770 [Ensete ventricosum]